MAAIERAALAAAGGSEYRVHLCFGPNCTLRGSRALWAELEQAIADAGLSGRVEMLATTCRNRCDYGPSLNVYPGPVFYNGIDAEAIQEIVHEHLAGDQVASRWLFRPRLEIKRRAEPCGRCSATKTSSGASRWPR